MISKIGNRLLTVIDRIAVLIAFLSFAIVVGSTLIAGVFLFLRGVFTALLAALLGVFTDLREWIRALYGGHEGKILLIITAVAVLWCGIRWKALNKRG